MLDRQIQTFQKNQCIMLSEDKCIFILLSIHKATAEKLTISIRRSIVSSKKIDQAGSMESAVKQIHNRLVSLMQSDNNASTAIMKKFLRYYTEGELDKLGLAKELCTSKDMEYLTKKINDKFGSNFKEEGSYYKRASKLFIFGIRLPKELLSAAARFKANYQTRLQRHQQLAPSRVSRVSQTKAESPDEESGNAGEYVFEEKDSPMVESRVTNNPILKGSRVKTDIGNRLKEAFRSTAKPSREDMLEKKARELEAENRNLQAVIDYLMKHVVELTDSERRPQNSPINEPNLSSRAIRQLRSLS